MDMKYWAVFNTTTGAIAYKVIAPVVTTPPIAPSGYDVLDVGSDFDERESYVSDPGGSPSISPQTSVPFSSDKPGDIMTTTDTLTITCSVSPIMWRSHDAGFPNYQEDADGVLTFQTDTANSYTFEFYTDTHKLTTYTIEVTEQGGP